MFVDCQENTCVQKIIWISSGSKNTYDLLDKDLIQGPGHCSQAFKVESAKEWALCKTMGRGSIPGKA